MRKKQGEKYHREILFIFLRVVVLKYAKLITKMMVCLELTQHQERKIFC